MLHETEDLISFDANTRSSTRPDSFDDLHAMAKDSILVPSQLLSEQARLQTFLNWPPEWASRLARSGFYCPSGGQSIRCAFCGLEISHFSGPYDAIVRHWQNAGLYCRFLKGKEHEHTQQTAGTAHNMSRSTRAILPALETCRRVCSSHLIDENPRRTEVPLLGTVSTVTPTKRYVSEPKHSTPMQQYASHSQPPDIAQGYSKSSPGRPQPQQNGQLSPWSEIIATARYPHMAAFQTRLDTLTTWPLVSPSAKQLARAGLFYVKADHALHWPVLNIAWGNQDVVDSSELQWLMAASDRRGRSDSVMCFWCGQRLYHWKPTDDALLEHGRLSPGCRYVTQILGPQLHQDVVSVSNAADSERSLMTDEYRPFQTQTSVASPIGNHLDQLMHTSSVQSVLSMGFQPELVRDVLRTHGLSQPLDTHRLCHLVLQAAGDPCGSNSLEAQFQDAVAEEKRRLCHGSRFILASSTRDPARLQLRKDETSSTQRHVSSASPEKRKDRAMCSVCSEEEVRMMFRPCNHLVCCARCSDFFANCPVCQLAIDNKVTTYLV